MSIDRVELGSAVLRGLARLPRASARIKSIPQPGRGEAAYRVREPPFTFLARTPVWRLKSYRAARCSGLASYQRSSCHLQNRTWRRCSCRSRRMPPSTSINQALTSRSRRSAHFLGASWVSAAPPANPQLMPRKQFPRVGSAATGVGWWPGPENAPAANSGAPGRASYGREATHHRELPPALLARGKSLVSRGALPTHLGRLSVVAPSLVGAFRWWRRFATKWRRPPFPAVMPTGIINWNRYNIMRIQCG